MGAVSVALGRLPGRLIPGNQEDLDAVIEESVVSPSYPDVIMQHSKFPEAALIMSLNHPDRRVRNVAALVLNKRGIELEEE
jgi:hypothetical protein